MRISFLSAVLFLFLFFRLAAQQPGRDSTNRSPRDSTQRTSPDPKHSPARDTAPAFPRRSALDSVTVRGVRPLIVRQLDKTVVNIDQSITSAGSTVLEAMQRLPGVQMTPDGQVSINGRSGVNVYLDGKPTYLSATDLAGLLSGMPASTIQRIEIMTNPSAKYDASGTSGIINIVKKKEQSECFNATVSTALTQGYYGRYNGSLLLNYRNHRFNVFLNNSYTYNKTLFRRFLKSDILNRDRSLLTEQVSDNNNINTSRTYRPAIGIDWYVLRRTIVSLSGTGGIGLSSERTLSGLDILDGRHSKIEHEDFTSFIPDHPINYTTTMQLSHRLDSASGEFTIDMDYSSYRNRPVQDNRAISVDSNSFFLHETDLLLKQKRRLNIYSIKSDYIRPLKNGRLEAGAKSSYVRMENDNTYYDQTGGISRIDTSQSSYSVNSELINAAYLNVVQAYKKMEAQAGLRVEQTATKGEDRSKGLLLDRNYLQLFPSLFLRYTPDPRNAFSLRMGRRTERAAYSEMIPFRRPLTPTLFFQGNPNLKPHLSWHSELGWTWKNAFSVTMGLDIDHDYIQTLPYLDSNKTTITRRPTNVQAHSWNIDLGYSKKLTSWWSTDNTLSFYRNAFAGLANGYKLEDPGIVSVYLGLTNSFPITGRLSAEVAGEYNSRRHLVNSSFGPYSIVNAGLKWRMWKEKGSLTLNAHNILQSEGHDVIDHYTGLDQYAYYHFFTRWISLNLLYRFGSAKTMKSTIRSGSEEEQQRAGK